ncbi:MAG: primosomal protein N' (replication factor Y) - superfamily II helicase [Pseudomonadota bacterium]
MAELPCANCGAQLTYNPGAANLTCPYCGSENEVPDDDSAPWDRPEQQLVERDLQTALAELARADTADDAMVVTTTVKCEICGAEVGFDEPAEAGEARREATIAEDCPFCASPLSREQAHSHRHPVPQGVLPFAIAELRARKALKAWLATRWFAPNDLKRYAEAGRPIQGVYVPHYTYDAQATCRYRGQRGDAYYVTKRVTVNGKTQSRRERRVRWRSASGTVRRHFDDVLVPATATLTEFSSDADVEAGRRWDLDGMQGYNTGYLAGFRAEAPSLPLGDGFERAAVAMESALRTNVRRAIGGDEQRIHSMDTRFDGVTFKHVLLPVWLAAYRYNNRPYRVAINGRTAEVRGERPYSWTKIAAAVLFVLLIVGAFVWAEANGYLGTG